MKERLKLIARIVTAAALAGSATMTLASDSDSDRDRDRDRDANFCMDVDLGPFHMVPGFMTSEGACAVRDYQGGWLQKKFYPFTIEDHQFNCEVSGDFTELPSGDLVPSSVMSEGNISGTIGGHPFSGVLLCASQTNGYQHFCGNPPNPPCFQLAQPFFDLIDRDPYPRVTEVSVFDGVITVQGNHNETAEVPLLMATRAAGITHLESLDPPQVGASITHSLLGLVTYEADDDEIEAKVLNGSLDVLLQGHIFFPDTVENDPAAARIKGSLCSKDLYQRLHRKEGEEHHD
jgi:hypothetical protein